jgi:hypothetical protein
MVEKTYKCDWCRDQHPPDAMMGLKWVQTNNGPELSKICPADAAPKHLCPNCVNQLKRILCVG